MIEARPSRTALRVAMRRAAHQLFDNPKVLDDPIAVPIIGPQAAEKLDDGKSRPIRQDTAWRKSPRVHGGAQPLRRRRAGAID